jgi:hypothetical protein
MCCYWLASKTDNGKYRDPSPFDFAQGQDDNVRFGVGVQDEDKEATTTADPYGMTTKKATTEAIRKCAGGSGLWLRGGAG